MVSYWRSSCSIFRLRLCPQTLCIFESHIIDPWSRQFMPAVRPRVTPRYSVWEGAVRMFGSGFAEFMAFWDCTPVTLGPTLITLPFGEATITRRRDAPARRLLPSPPIRSHWGQSLPLVPRGASPVLGAWDKPFGGTPPPHLALQCAHVELRTGCARAWHRTGDLRGTITRDDDMRCHSKQMQPQIIP